jgi:hypothetical protein
MGLDGAFHSQPQSHPKGTPPSELYRLQPWYDAYIAALFESDRGQMDERIRTAKRQLLAARAESAEQRALNNALHALHALRMCLK